MASGIPASFSPDQICVMRSIIQPDQSHVATDEPLPMARGKTMATADGARSRGADRDRCPRASPDEA